jgi:glycosyltransferase involved in cell wall biosynthesis
MVHNLRPLDAPWSTIGDLMDASLHVAITLEQFWHRVPGGTATAVWEMVRALSDRDIALTGVSAWHKRPPPLRFRLDTPIEWIPLPRRALYEAWHRFRRPKVEAVTGRVDVIHATTLAIPPKTAPLVVTLHDLAFLHDPGHFTVHGNRFFRRGLELAIEDADLVVCPSEATATDCRSHGFDAGRVRVVPWGVTIQRASERDVTDVRRRLELEDPYLLWTGTVEPRKNLPGLVEAFLSMDTDMTLVLAGPEGWNEDLGALISKGGDRIRTLGFVQPDDLRALYAGAEAFCYPSLFEGFGLPVIEAMAQGAPVITSAGTATEEAAGGAAVLVDPRDPASIAAGIAEALDNRGPLRETALARAGDLTWEACAERMEAVYREAVPRAAVFPEDPA